MILKQNDMEVPDEWKYEVIDEDENTSAIL